VGAIGPVVAIFSTLFFSSLSDRKIEAQKLLGILALTGSIFLWIAFTLLHRGWHPGWFIFFQGCTAFITAPMFPLLTKIMLTHLPNTKKSFPLYSLCGTLGWMGAGWLVSFLKFDFSAEAGQIAAVLRFFMGCICFLLPITLPSDNESKGWKAALGLSAFGLLKDKHLRVFYFASMIIMVPYVSFYMIVPTMLKDFGSGSPAAEMTIGQVTEIFAMIILSVFAGVLRFRWLVVTSMGLGVIRFILYAAAGETGLIQLVWLGIALHGPIYAFMSVTGKMFVDQRVDKKMRGQAQALYTLLTVSVAGILGNFFCDSLYMHVRSQQVDFWSTYWIILAAITLIAFTYFFVGFALKART